MSQAETALIFSAVNETRLQTSLARAAARKGPSIGQWLELPGYSLARTVAGLGEDWALIDCEHGNIDDRDMYLQVAAIAAAGVSPIVRIPALDTWMMKRALDAGAHGIMVPMCETKEQAELVVRGCKYPSAHWPQGIRGTGAMFAPNAFNQSGREYLTHANDNVTIVVQIETRQGVENSEAIASVEGIDMLFVGPNDLASSMGYLAFGHATIPEVQEATTKVLRAAKAAGKYAGHFDLSAEAAAKKYMQGFDFVNSGADIVALTAWMSSELTKLKDLIEGSESQPRSTTAMSNVSVGYS
ncbi:Phosphoenolpyruvate/pyruvate domain-containing protein [Aspergillus indologenus CBS 114.80]|uniref:Phosphoenolpyruvate/pyruvate domain-containing protein n=1 Tax=Aspergillus indologenus CBS 114.80 TaxID=1450541 RepID=A0A2V5I9J2_9EURO|nr:Phosphoenolpyruvate/pyruvate domain-containing protein [Aspergillus indologenus CBS 114.80]